MNEHSRKAKLLMILSTILFVAFCALSPTGHPVLFGAVSAEILNHAGYLAGIAAWTLMSVAWSLQRKSGAAAAR